jgi:hypothetical protein
LGDVPAQSAISRRHSAKLEPKARRDLLLLLSGARVNAPD